MTDEYQVFDVPKGALAELRLTFEGIARYAAYLYRRKPGGGWEWLRTLEEQGHSADAKPDNFSIQAPTDGQDLLLFVSANMTSPVPKANLGMTAEVLVAGKSMGKEVSQGSIQSGGYIPVEVRAIIRGAAK